MIDYHSNIFTSHRILSEHLPVFFRQKYSISPYDAADDCMYADWFRPGRQRV